MMQQRRRGSPQRSTGLGAPRALIVHPQGAPTEQSTSSPAAYTAEMPNGVVNQLAIDASQEQHHQSIRSHSLDRLQDTRL